MQWLRENTPEDAVIASWWDYGYWISTLGERKTLADNSTLLDWQIRKIAAMYMSTPEDAWQILTTDVKTDVSSYYVTLPSDTSLDVITTSSTWRDLVVDLDREILEQFKYWKDVKGQCMDLPTVVLPGKENCAAHQKYDPDKAEKYPTLFDYYKSEVYRLPPVVTGLDADYVIINLAVQKLPAENIVDLYTLLQKGGDETKSFWFMKITDLRVADYYNPELTGYSSKFWNETLLGKLIPFTHILYVDPNNPEIQSETYKRGYTSIYVKDIKFPSDGDGPFQLVYLPPSFEMDAPGPLTGPLIYKINKEYNPNQ
jgi:dolichyl-diphosphooligosaccharide--protein glycosyltransferase